MSRGLTLRYIAGEDIELGHTVAISIADGKVYRARPVGCHLLGNAVERIREGKRIAVTDGEAREDDASEGDKAWADAVLHGTGYTIGWNRIPIDKVIDMTKEMPVYISHKKVRALEIRSIGAYRASATDKDGLEREIVFADPGFPRIWVPSNMFVRYTPMPGDYYVVYEDGYASFSPRKAFLEGYIQARPESMLMEQLVELSEFAGIEPPPSLIEQVGRIAREAYVTINSLKHQLETKDREKADPDQS